jgi:hypothetical protein
MFGERRDPSSSLRFRSMFSPSQQRDHDHQRPQAELKPAAFSLRRVSFGLVGLHGRIIPEREEPEQGIVTRRLVLLV